MPFDFYYELIKCKGKGTLYYVEAWEEEVIIHQLILSFFKNPLVRAQINKQYEKVRDKCSSMCELKKIIAERFVPLVT